MECIILFHISLSGVNLDNDEIKIYINCCAFDCM